jgi:hypothetical protein
MASSDISTAYTGSGKPVVNAVSRQEDTDCHNIAKLLGRISE